MWTFQGSYKTLLVAVHLCLDIARGGHSYTSYRTVCDRGQDASQEVRPLLALVKQSRRLLGTGRRSRRIIRLTVKAAIIKCKRADPPMPPYIIIQTMPVIAGGAYAYVCVCSIALLPMCLVVVGVSYYINCYMVSYIHVYINM